MKRYRITYRDTGEGPLIQFTAIWAGENAEHAVMRFQEAEDSDGWEVVKVERFKEVEKP